MPRGCRTFSYFPALREGTSTCHFDRCAARKRRDGAVDVIAHQAMCSMGLAISSSLMAIRPFGKREGQTRDLLTDCPDELERREEDYRYADVRPWCAYRGE